MMGWWNDGIHIQWISDLRPVFGALSWALLAIRIALQQVCSLISVICCIKLKMPKKFSTKILKAKHGRSRSYTNHRAPCRFAPHAERKRERWRIAIIRSYLQDGPAGFYTINWCIGIVKKVDPRFREHTLATIEVAKLGDHATKGLPFLPSMSMTYTMLERFLIENIVRPLKYLYKDSIIFSCLILVDQTVYANTTEY